MGKAELHGGVLLAWVDSITKKWAGKMTFPAHQNRLRSPPIQAAPIVSGVARAQGAAALGGD
jgi:hypothetical protein